MLQVLLTHSHVPPDGSDFMGNRLVVQFARGNRPKEMLPFHQERTIPRTRRTIYRMSITGLAPDTSWQVRETCENF